VVQGAGTVIADEAAEAFVYLDNQAIALTTEQQAIKGCVKRFGKLFFGKEQGFFGLLGFADIDHQAAHHGLLVVRRDAGNVA